MSCNTRDFVSGIRVTFDGTGTELSITYIIICESNKKQKKLSPFLWSRKNVMLKSIKDTNLKSDSALPEWNKKRNYDLW